MFSLSKSKNNTDIILGNGFYSTVKKGYFDNQMCAIKIIKKIPKLICSEKIENEYLINKQINHKHICKLLHFVSDSFFYYFIFEYNFSISLNKKFNISFDNIKHITYQITDTLEYLHKKLNIVHGDIKEDNILINSYFNIQLCDFGLSEKLPKNKTYVILDTIQGTQGYIAPEMYSERIFGTCTDYWCLGIILFKLIFNYHPFRPFKQCIKEKVKINKKIDNNLHLRYQKIEEKDYYSLIQLIQKLLEKNYLKRLHIQNV